ncbi:MULTISPECIES: hypothetical protein [unclassified Rhodanobacter]|uniref:hypothetical protein n=1 Tax=unclassified Rhodanobacter TaxID=2621553 RepID=UPI00129034CA|nr:MULTISPECIES: hypothetical protein [unclassified Rhodanobacter]
MSQIYQDQAQPFDLAIIYSMRSAQLGSAARRCRRIFEHALSSRFGDMLQSSSVVDSGITASRLAFHGAANFDDKHFVRDS